MKKNKRRHADHATSTHTKSDTQKTIDFLRMTIIKEGSIFRFAREAGVITRKGRLTYFYKQKI